MNVTKNKAGANVYSHVFNYTDHLGNIRLSYTLVPNLNDLGFRTAILEENHYYPFGLKYKKYGSVDKQLVLVEGGGDYWIGVAVVPEGSRKTYQYKYKGQERQDELGLNWDMFRYRNYDFTIGRFFGIDPIAEEFYDISTYQFAHNNPVWKIELEGLEGVAFQVLVNADATARPNGVGAHLKGFCQGLINSAKGLYNAVTNPVQTAKGLGNTTLAAAAHAAPGASGQLNAMQIDNALGTNAMGATKAVSSSVSKGVKNLVSGNGEQRGEILGEIAGSIVGAKGMNAAVKGVSNVLTKTANVGTEAAAIEQTAVVPVGRLGNPMDVTPGTNTPSVINGRTFTGHALDQMQGRGLTPSVINDVIENGVVTPGNATRTFVNELNGVRAVTNQSAT